MKMTSSELRLTPKVALAEGFCVYAAPVQFPCKYRKLAVVAGAETPATHVLPAAAAPRLGVRTTLPSLPAPGVDRVTVARPLLNVLTVALVSQATRLPGWKAKAMLAGASTVHASAALVTKLVPFQYCASTGTCSGTSWEPLRFVMTSLPKRMALLPSSTRSLPLAGTSVSRLKSAARRVTRSPSVGTAPSRNDSNGPSGLTARLIFRSAVRLPTPAIHVALEV